MATFSQSTADPLNALEKLVIKVMKLEQADATRWHVVLRFDNARFYACTAPTDWETAQQELTKLQRILALFGQHLLLHYDICEEIPHRWRERRDVPNATGGRRQIA